MNSFLNFKVSVGLYSSCVLSIVQHGSFLTCTVHLTPCMSCCPVTVAIAQVVFFTNIKGRKAANWAKIIITQIKSNSTDSLSHQLDSSGSRHFTSILQHGSEWSYFVELIWTNELFVVICNLRAHSSTRNKLQNVFLVSFQNNEQRCICSQDLTDKCMYRAAMSSCSIKTNQQLF